MSPFQTVNWRGDYRGQFCFVLFCFVEQIRTVCVHKRGA